MSQFILARRGTPSRCLITVLAVTAAIGTAAIVPAASAVASTLPTILQEPSLTVLAPNSVTVTAQVRDADTTLWQRRPSGSSQWWQPVPAGPGISSRYSPDSQGATTLEISDAAAFAGDDFRVMATNHSDSSPTLSDVIRLPRVGEAAPRIVEQPLPRNGARMTLPSKVSGTPTPTVAWEFRRAGSAVWTTLVNDAHAFAPDLPDAYGNNTLTLTPTAADLASAWREVARSPLGTAYSNVVPRLPAGGEDAPRFTADAHVALTAPGTFTASTRVVGAPAPSLVWQYQKPGSAVWNTISASDAHVDAPASVDAEGSASMRITPSWQETGYLWRVVASNVFGSKPSAAFRLPGQAPSFLVQPTVINRVDLVYTIKAVSTGTPVPRTVWWQYRPPGGAWTPIYSDPHVTMWTTNGEGTLRVIAAPAELANSWRAGLWDPARNTWTYSDAIVLPDPNRLSLAVTQQPQNAVRASAGNLTVYAAANGNPTPKIVWQAKDANGVWQDQCDPCANAYRAYLDANTTMAVRAKFVSEAGVVVTDDAVLRAAPAPTYDTKVSPGLRYLSDGDRPVVYSAVNGRDDSYVQYHPSFAARIGADGAWTIIAPNELAGRIHVSPLPDGRTTVTMRSDFAWYDVLPDDPQLRRAGAETVYFTVAWWGCPTGPASQPDRFLIRDPATKIITGCRGGAVPDSELTVFDNDAAQVQRASSPVLTRQLPARTVVVKNTETGVFGSDNWVHFDLAATADHPVDVTVRDGDTELAQQLNVAQPEAGIALKLSAGDAMSGKTYTVRVADSTDPSLYVDTSTRILIAPWRFALPSQTAKAPYVLMNELGGWGDQLGGPDLQVRAAWDSSSLPSALPSTGSVLAPGTMVNFETQILSPLSWGLDYRIGDTAFGVRLSGGASGCQVIKTSSPANPISSSWTPVTDSPYTCDGPLTSGVIPGWESARNYAVRLKGQTQITIDAAQDPADATKLISSLCDRVGIFSCRTLDGQWSDTDLPIGKAAAAPPATARYNCERPESSRWQPQVFSQIRSVTYAKTYSTYWGLAVSVGGEVSAGGASLGGSASFYREDQTGRSEATSKDILVNMQLYPGEIGFVDARIPARMFVGSVVVESQNIQYVITNARFRGPDNTKLDSAKVMHASASGVYTRQMTDSEMRTLCGQPGG